MKTVRSKCAANYRHYFETVGGECSEKDDLDCWMRELVLICARCGTTIYVDSIIRPWLGVSDSNDWGI